MTSPVWFTRNGIEYTGKAAITLTKVAGAAYFKQPRVCGRCGGAGGADKWAHTGWTCFQCGGSGKSGTEKVKLYTADKLAKLDASSVKRHAKKEAALDVIRQAKADAERAGFAAWYARSADWVAEVKKVLPWLTDSEFSFVHGVYLAKVEMSFTPSEAMDEKTVEIVQRAANRQRAKEDSRYLGDRGDKVTFTGKAKELYYRPAENYGWSPLFIYSFKGDGFTVIYKGSKSFRDGETYSIKATIKELAEYKDGTKQTIIQRPTILQ